MGRVGCGVGGGRVGVGAEWGFGVGGGRVGCGLKEAYQFSRVS